MTRPWHAIDTLETRDGTLELRSRAADDFHLYLDGRILMNSRESRSEEALGRWAAETISGRAGPRLLVAGLGMGITLRAALSALPPGASVLVAEIEPRVVGWCRGPLREVCGDALSDPRVRVEARDVAEVIREGGPRFDAIALDLYEGVRLPDCAPGADPFWGDAALARSHAALRAPGVLGRWCERPDPAFEARAARAGFRVERRRAGRGGRQHTVYLAHRT